MNELRNALWQRKELCLERELQALARLRGVAAEEIAKDELDRVPFSTGISLLRLHNLYHQMGS
jgi:uncharacterized protein YecE (DUF72 family)